MIYACYSHVSVSRTPQILPAHTWCQGGGLWRKTCVYLKNHMESRAMHNASLSRWASAKKNGTKLSATTQSCALTASWKDLARSSAAALWWSPVSWWCWWFLIMPEEQQQHRQMWMSHPLVLAALLHPLNPSWLWWWWWWTSSWLFCFSQTLNCTQSDVVLLLLILLMPPSSSSSSISWLTSSSSIAGFSSPSSISIGFTSWSSCSIGLTTSTSTIFFFFLLPPSPPLYTLINASSLRPLCFSMDLSLFLHLGYFRSSLQSRVVGDDLLLSGFFPSFVGAKCRFVTASNVPFLFLVWSKFLSGWGMSIEACGASFDFVSSLVAWSICCRFESIDQTVDWFFRK